MKFPWRRFFEILFWIFISSFVSKILPMEWFSSGLGVIAAAILAGFSPIPRYSLYFLARRLTIDSGYAPAIAFLFGTTISESLAATSFEIRYLGWRFWIKRIALTLFLVILLSYIGGWVLDNLAGVV